LKIFLLVEEQKWCLKKTGALKKWLTKFKTKKSGFTTFFEFKVAGEVLIAFETEFRRERVMRFLTVSLDKHAISWAERRRTKLKSTKLNYHGNITTIQEKKTEISDILRL
jgi:small subunit ribosomal protein S6